MTKPRVFVGTMYSREAEFCDSAQMVAQQQDLVSLYHHVVSDLPEAEAHNVLWSEWNRVKGNYDLFVKVDADTILRDYRAIADVWKLFENPRVTGAQLKLYDYFTDDLIAGLNFFTPQVVFNTSPELYCDRVDTNHDIVMKGPAVAGMGLEPIGLHCKNPSDVQAFHFGMHRTLKNQLPTLRAVYAAYLRLGGRARALALVGAGVAQNERDVFAAQNSYGSEAMKKWTVILPSLHEEFIDTLAHSFAGKMGWIP